MRPPAVVMNMFYTGLGIARSLGEQRIPVIGLTAHRGTYGNFTRYAKVYSCPDSREEPEALLRFLLQLGDGAAKGAVIFPTRDNDVLFLDRFRKDLCSRFRLALPGSDALHGCLNKWETFRWAKAAGVPVPQCWTIETNEDLPGLTPQLTFPCVLKPISAHHWRERQNWQTVGNRKAIGIFSPAELLAEYERISRAESRALIQELVPGDDDCLHVAACYLNHQSKFVAGFTAQKLLQEPERFGTGCIVQTVDRPELLPMAAGLLEKMRFTGIAEVEFKWDSRCGEYVLIEINPRPWDQHSLGKACGIDLIHIAYCDLAGQPLPAIPQQTSGHKWIADDAFSYILLRSLWRRDGSFRPSLRLARGRRTYAISSRTDPLPLLAFITRRLLPNLITTVARLSMAWTGRRVIEWLTGRKAESQGVV